MVTAWLHMQAYWDRSPPATGEKPLMFSSIKYSSSNQSGGFLLLQSLPGHPLTCSFSFSGQIWSPWTKWDERMLTKQNRQKTSPQPSDLSLCWDTPDRKNPEFPFGRCSVRSPGCPQRLAPTVPGQRHGRGSRAALAPGAPPEPPWRLPWPGTCAPGMAQGRTLAGKLAGLRSWQEGWQGREAGGSPRSPRSGHSAAPQARLRAPGRARRCSGGGSGQGSELGSCSPPRRYHLGSHAVPAKNIAFKHCRHLQRGRRAGWMGTASHSGPG